MERSVSTVVTRCGTPFGERAVDCRGAVAMPTARFVCSGKTCGGCRAAGIDVEPDVVTKPEPVRSTHGGPIAASQATELLSLIGEAARVLMGEGARGSAVSDLVSAASARAGGLCEPSDGAGRTMDPSACLTREILKR